MGIKIGRGVEYMDAGSNSGTVVTVHSVQVTGKNPYKICFANGFLLFKLHIFSRNAQFSTFLTCEQ